MKTDLCQFCGQCWAFQICWHIECTNFIASSFRIWEFDWNSFTPLTLHVVMLFKAHRFLIPGCLALVGDHTIMVIWVMKIFSVYSCHLFLILSASVKSILFLSIFAWNVRLVSLLFLTSYLVFPILLFPSISLHWSQRKAFLSLLAILGNSALKWVYLSFSPLPFASLLFSAIGKASSDSHFSFFGFLFLGDDLDHCFL